VAGKDNLIPFQPGQSGNPNGRPKRIYKILKQSGYSKEDIRDAFEEVGWQTEEQAQEIIDDPSKPLLLKTLAHAFIKAANKGDYRYVGEIIQQIMGKPKEQTENKHLHKIIVEYVNPNNNTLSSTRGTDEGVE
jgi:hypothetical protein